MRFLAILGAAVALAGCSGDPGTLASSARDSAGVRVVESHGAEWDEGEAWEVASEPTLRVGVLEGDSLYQFGDIADVARLEDGTVVVLDRGYSQLRFYDAGGEFVRQVGGSGDGPGEYRRPVSLGLAGPDSLWVYDGAQRRFTYLDREGRLLGSATLPSSLSVSSPQRFADGTYAMTPGFSSSQLGRNPRTGTVRDTSAVLRVGPNGVLVDTIGVWPGLEIFALVRDGSVAMFGIPRWGRTRVHATHDQQLHIGLQNEWEIRTYDTDGRLLRIARRPSVDLALTREMIAADERALEESLAELPEAERAAARRSYGEYVDPQPIPDRVPAHGSIRADVAGNLWVQDYSRIGGEASSSYTVLDPEGRMLGRVELPEGLRVYEIGDDYVLGSWTDEMDVEYAVLHALTRPVSAGG